MNNNTQKYIIKLLRDGYFPRELPPPFNTEMLGNTVETSFEEYIDISIKSPVTNCVKHTIPRTRTLRRPLSIPNPFGFINICHALSAEIDNIIKISEDGPYSLTTPKIDNDGHRAFKPKFWFDDLPKFRAEKRASAKIMLKADVSRFYSSIYTHSIPWALHGKQSAKKNKQDNTLSGNLIDRALRNSQDGQTIGIAIGPDTSLLLAELILAKVDTIIHTKTKLSGIRFVDDYEIYCQSQSEADRAINELEKSLAHYELQLNSRKVAVVELPYELENEWVSTMRTISISDGPPRKQHYDLLHLFDQTARLSKKYQDESVTKYCMSMLFGATIHEDNKLFVASFLTQCLTFEPSLTKNIISILFKHFQTDIDDTLSKKLAYLQHNAIIRALEHCIAREYSNEAAWLIWMCILFSINIPRNVFENSLKVHDSIILITSLDAFKRGLIDGDTDYSELDKLLTDEDFNGSLWLALYELTQKHWAPDSLRKKINSHEAFSRLITDGVSFYDSDSDPLQLTALNLSKKAEHSVSGDTPELY